ncbi:MAG TPA: hypothetical protein VGN57_10215 [Pirellulaceae bacterium]|jgi:hypothetical protein|nr:hypothetical protein [Pirellulaceae bacterium]
MTTSEAKANPYAPPLHASAGPSSRALRPDERAYLSQHLACRNGIPPISTALLALLSQSVWTAVAAGVGAAALGIVTGVLLDLAPGQLLGILFVLFLSIGGTMAYREVSTVQRTYALWEVATRVHDYSAMQSMLETGQLLRQEEKSSTMLRSDDEPVTS